MQNITPGIKILLAISLVFLIGSCEEDYFQEPPKPATSEQTLTLEAYPVSKSPSTISDSYWKTADYLKVNAVDVSINQLYGDGMLNMTGTYAGLTSFNAGAAANLTLKAAYDSVNLYILAEWTDSDLDLSNSSWLFNGPTDPKKADSNLGWTSQRNSDRIAFAFDINNASGPAGNFSSVGCAASCHGSGLNAVMNPISGTVDLWNWSLAKTAPLGYAEDMLANTDSLGSDGGQRMFERNVNGSTNRSGPAYEWDGVSQNTTLSNGTSTILDPAFYIFNKMPFIGDAARGDSLYHTVAPPGDCVGCHGVNGGGGSESAINGISQNKKSRAALISSMDAVPDMVAYWGPLSSVDKNDIVAYLRGLSGVPGYCLSTPSGSNADIMALSNVTPIQIKNAMLPVTNVHTTYQVLFIRKLKTNNTDDAAFTPATKSTYTFGVALMDNDGKNHIGSKAETLTFK